MAMMTATEVTLYTDISATAAAIDDAGLIPIVTERINFITNNYFISDKIYYQGTFTSVPASDTITCESNLHDLGFYSGDEFYLYNTYRNDGYYTAETVSAETIVISSAQSIVEEPSGASALFSLVQWPAALKYIAAQMIKYDYDDRKAITAGMQAESLGPYSYRKAETNASQPYGYPKEIIESLAQFTAARLR